MRLLVFIVLCPLIGCAQASFYRKPTPAEEETLIWEDDLTVQQQTYLMNLRREPLDFEMTGSAGDKAWARAKEFVADHSAMKVLESGQRKIRTQIDVAPAGYVPKTCEVGYLVTREPKGRGYTFCIRTFAAAPDWVPCELGRRRNARILSRYLRTGELDHPEFIEK